MSYIGKVQIGTDTPVLLGSTLYGICNTPAATAAKTIPASDDSGGKFINTHYNTLVQGTTIHVKFTNGNSVTSGITLAVGSTAACDVIGNCVCDAGVLLSFTLDENEKWVVNDNVNTEYVFKTAYNANSNRALTESDIAAAATHNVDSSIVLDSQSTNLPTSAAVAAFVQEQTGGLSGLTGAMHFRGQVNTLPDATSGETYNTYVSGDVVLGPNNKEYVYVKANTAAASEWIELGDEGSYALKSSTAQVIGVQENGFTTNTLPTLTVTPTEIPNITGTGAAATFAVSSGILTITPGTAPTLGTAISVGSASNWNAGTQATLSTAATTVVVPDNSNP